MADKILIDVWSDLVCPWCYVGREHLVHAIDRQGMTGEVEIIHHAYQLDPSRERSQPLREWLSQKFGPTYESMTARVVEAGAKAGLTLDFQRGIAANTRAGHRLVHLAARSGKGDDMARRLMRAHFTDGLDIADPGVLTAIARDLGFSDDVTRPVIEGSLYDDEAQADVDVAREMGIRGVPFFVFDRRFAVSGAQPIEVFEDGLRRAKEPTPSENAEEPEPATT